MVGKEEEEGRARRRRGICIFGSLIEIHLSECLVSERIAWTVGRHKDVKAERQVSHRSASILFILRIVFKRSGVVGGGGWGRESLCGAAASVFVLLYK